MNKKMIIVQTLIKAPMGKVWERWTKPEHIIHWAFASDDWEAPSAENDLQIGGRFKTRMQAKDGSAGFNFGGVYTAIIPNILIEYDMDDPSTNSGQAVRQVKAEFEQTPEGVRVTQTFEPENENPEDMQRAGWQAILDNFKKYAEK